MLAITGSISPYKLVPRPSMKLLLPLDAQNRRDIKIHSEQINVGEGSARTESSALQKVVSLHSKNKMDVAEVKHFVSDKVKTQNTVSTPCSSSPDTHPRGVVLPSIVLCNILRRHYV